MKAKGKIIASVLAVTLCGISCLFAQRTDVQNPKSQMDKLATSHTEVFVVTAPIETVYDYVVAEDVLPKILKRYFIIPSVTGSKIQKGNWTTPGSFRTVYFDNGDTLKEELTNFDRPTYFAYKVSEFSSIQRFLTSNGTGQWWFTSQGTKTEVTWTYTFYAKSSFRKFFLKPFVDYDFRTYMKRTIQRIIHNIENGK